MPSMDIVRKMVEGSKKFSFFGALLKTSHYAVLFFQTHSQTNTPTRRQQMPLGGGVVYLPSHGEGQDDEL